VDAKGVIYVADRDNHRIRKIEGGKVTTLAGTGTAGFLDGTAASAKFFAPTGVMVDSKEDLYVADAGNNRIRKISNGTVTTFAGTGAAGYHDDYASKSTFNSPRGLAVDSYGVIYVADHGNSRVRKIQAGKVTTLSGLTGSGTKYVDFGNPNGVAVDGAAAVYVAEQKKHRILKVFANKVSVVAGVDGTAGFLDGPASTSKFNGPSGVAVDSGGNTVYVADLGNHRVREVAAGNTSTLAGTKAGLADGSLAQAKFNGPYGIAVDLSGRIYIADVNNNRIRMLIP
jgi:DNA-binding beta-propeller fold protein YncE